MRGTDGRMYPWGDEFDKNRCNSNISGVESTSPVNKYPDGVSLYGCYDMAGNVWEWCASWWDEQAGGRVIRGGSWVNSIPVFLRVSYRLMGNPDFRDDNIGFRLVQDIP